MKSLTAQLLHFTEAADELGAPSAVLDALDAITWPGLRIHSLCAVAMPAHHGNPDYQLGRTAFLHKSAPRGWWAEYAAQIRSGPPSPYAVMARVSIAPYRMTDMMRALEPLGAERWPFETNHRHGIRDTLGCPIGGRWVFMYWARQPMRLRPSERALLFLGALYAVARLQVLVPPFRAMAHDWRVPTPRELTVLHLLSTGLGTAEIAAHLGLGIETVRTHIHKAQVKLGANNRAHAVAQALRLRLIP